MGESQMAATYAGLRPDSHYAPVDEALERQLDEERGDDLLVDPSCACCCAVPRAGRTSGPRRFLSCLNVLLLLALLVFCLECGAVIYTVNLLSHLLALCRELRAFVIAVPICTGVLWMLGTALLVRSYRHRQEAHRKALMRLTLSGGGAGCNFDDAAGDALLLAEEDRMGDDVTSSGTRRCTRRRCLRLGLSATFWTLFALLNLAILVVFSLVLFMEMHTLPKSNGSIQSLRGYGLSGTTYIARSERDVLHISLGPRTGTGTTPEQDRFDLFFTQGFAHAQERLWQMEFQRAVGAGTLGELVGFNENAMGIDKLARTMGFARAARSALPGLSENSRAILRAYVAGVNAYIHSPSLALPLEFYLLGLSRPRDFTGEDVLAWTKVVSYMLSGNLDRELLRWDLHVLLGMDWGRIQQLMPPYDQDRFPVVLEGELDEAEDMGGFDHVRDAGEEPMIAWKRSAEGRKYVRAMRARAAGGRDSSASSSSASPGRMLSSPSAPFARFRSVFGPSTASNNWVVGGGRTRSAQPILANDPHLQLMAPSIWVMNHLEGAAATTTAAAAAGGGSAPAAAEEGFMSVGASFAGVPGVIIGRNRHISWGVTNTGADCQDLFIMDEVNHTHYRWNGAVLPYTLRDEIIRVKGDKHKNVLWPVRESVYGPVISDLAFDEINSADLSSGPALSLRWTSLDAEDNTFDAFMDCNTASNWTEFITALESYKAPAQNMIFAAAGGDGGSSPNGTIGYTMTGMVPLRPLNGTGLSPVPGNGTFDWAPRYAPYASMPRVQNPKKGYIATANNAVVPRGYKVYITGDWDEGSDGYRARRITDLITGEAQRQGRGMQPYRADTHNLPQPAHEQEQQRPSIDNQYVMRMQQDYYSGIFDDFRSLVLPHLQPQSAAGQALLLRWTGGAGIAGAWDGHMSVGTRDGALFQRFYTAAQTLAGSTTNTTYWADSQFILRILSGQIEDPLLCTWNTSASVSSSAASSASSSSAAAAPPVPSCPAWSSSLVDFVASPSRPFAGERWGVDVHRAAFTHQILSQSPLACVADREVAHGGDFSTVNVGTYDTESADKSSSHSSSGSGSGSVIGGDFPTGGPRLPQSHGPSYRQVVDWSDVASRSAFVHGPGQSGNLLSAHYDDLTHMWAEGEYVWMDRGEVSSATLTLRP